MKHYLLLLIILAFTNLQLFSKSIDEPTAKTIAATFLSSVSGTSQLKNGENIELIYKATALFGQSLKNSSGSEAAQTTYFYIYSSSKEDNFVIVSGDDRAKPILGYSNTSSFDPGNIPPNMKAWLDGYISEIQYAIVKDLKAGEEITAQWFNLSQGIGMNATAIVEPLIKTHWAQSPYYNDLCPYDNTEGELVATGCTATAMAQIMKYWNYPDKGTGTHSYIPFRHPEYGVISADFGNTRYDWAAMPDQISAPNEEIAKLMFHCGVSVDMDYGTDNSFGKTFNYNHPSALFAFRNYFGYKRSNSCIYRPYMSGSEWINLIKTELNENRPVLYSGDDPNHGGHSFVCDGYDNYYYLHFNWGWGGNADGYFSTDAINIQGSLDFTEKQKAVIGIEPLTINPEVDIQFNSKLSISPSVYLNEGQAFQITEDFINFGSVTFEDSISARLFDYRGYLVDIIQNSNIIKLPKGVSSGNITFSTNGISAMKTGEYYIGFWCKSTDFVKSSINENGFYRNLKKVFVTNNVDPIEPDRYESNNLESTAYEIIPTLTNKTATLVITANIHNISDVDFYKIKLPLGYSYSITTTLVDECLDVFLENDYSVDGKFSYKLNDGSWSVPEDLFLQFTYTPNDEYLYIKAEPFLTRYMGTYDLALIINQNQKIIPLTQDMVAYYPFNGNADDESGNGNNGTIYGATLTQDRFGKSNSAFWFNGISDFIQVPDAPILDMTSKVSITGWLKKEKNVPWSSMLTKGGEFGLENNYSLQISENNGMVFTTDNQNTKSSKSLSLNEWHFVAFTWDGDTTKFYLDGIADSSSFTILSNSFVPNNSSLYIGVDKPWSDEYFSGYLDDIMIFNREINRTEVALLNSGTFTRIADDKKQSNQQLQVFPNPLTHSATITFSNPNNMPYDLYISNVIGERVLKIGSITNNTITLKNMCLPKGIYLLEMKGQNTQKGKMIVIE